jgi:tRNA nucleotidyltransferase (CCA-adding enzyme)
MASERSAASGALLLERLGELPGGAELAALARERDDVELVGGALRDLLLEREPRELDVVLGGGAIEFARALAQRLGGDLRTHERFGTALVRCGAVRIDVATRRAESYPRPGALPDVRPGSADEDLARRDFTVNAIALALGGPRRGELRAAPHALEDLERRLLRVLHAGSFIDDPTRILRLHRYAARLDFAPERQTQEWASQALAGGALATVSPARIGAELRLALAEPDPLATLVQLRRGGVLERLGQPLALTLQPEVLTAALEALPAEGDRVLTALAALLLGARRDALRSLLDAWELPAAERDVVVEAATRAAELARALAGAERDSQVHAVLAPVALETVALVVGVAESSLEPARARRFLSALRHVRLQIGGEDLLAAGMTRGPQVGSALRHALACKLDGELGPAREDELAAALAAEARR